MDIVPIVDVGLGNSSYVVDLGDGSALVVDPERDPSPYLEVLSAENYGYGSPSRPTSMPTSSPAAASSSQRGRSCSPPGEVTWLLIIADWKTARRSTSVA